MNKAILRRPDSLIGIGIYTPADAFDFTGVRAAKVRRWLRGHRIKDRRYLRLWAPQIDIGDDNLYLGFRDLTEVRVVNALIEQGLSAHKVRRAIEIARNQFGMERPLSTRRFRTDGKQVFLILSDETPGRLIDVFKRQYAIREVIEPTFRGLEFDEVGEPTRWRIAPGVLLDPARSFGQPIDEQSGVPTVVLAAAVTAEGSNAAAAKVYDVPLGSVQRAVAFEKGRMQKRAA